MTKVLYYLAILYTVPNLTTHARHGVTPLSLTDFSKTAIFIEWCVRSEARPWAAAGWSEVSLLCSIMLVTTLATEKQGITAALMTQRGGEASSVHLLPCILH